MQGLLARGKDLGSDGELGHHCWIPSREAMAVISRRVPLDTGWRPD